MSETGDAAARRVVDAPLVPPSTDQGLPAVFKRRYLLKLLVKREIGARYQGSFLGLFWSYINPLSQLFIFWFVFTQLLGRFEDIDAYAIHIFCGLIVVQFFVETFNGGTRSIVQNQALVRRMAMPREMFPVASMLVSFYHLGPQLLILVGICLVLGWTPTVVGMLGFLLAILIIAVLGTGLALMFSVANVFLRDVSSVVNILTNFIRFGVPMIYPFTLVEERFGDHHLLGLELSKLYLYNPIADAVLLVQQAFWVGSTGDPKETAAEHIPDYLFSHAWLSLAIAVVFLGLGQYVFSRMENKIPEQL